jgi:hypothetical protein
MEGLVFECRGCGSGNGDASDQGLPSLGTNVGEYDLASFKRAFDVVDAGKATIPSFVSEP